MGERSSGRRIGPEFGQCTCFALYTPHRTRVVPVRPVSFATNAKVERERERERERQTDRQTDRQTETQRQRDRWADRQTDRQVKGGGQRNRN